MMTSAQVVETSVKIVTNNPSLDYTHSDNHTSQTYDSSTLLKKKTLEGLLFSTGVLTVVCVDHERNNGVDL